MFTTLNTVIYKNNETVYTNTVKNDNNLDSLMSHLKSLQQNVNEFFTALIGTDVPLNQEKNLTDEESDEADEKFENEDISQVKKCKYSG